MSSSSSSAAAAAAPLRFAVGDEVIANWQGDLDEADSSRWHHGVVDGVDARAGTYNIRYVDGNVERGVWPGLVRLEAELSDADRLRPSRGGVLARLKSEAQLPPRGNADVIDFSLEGERARGRYAPTRFEDYCSICFDMGGTDEGLLICDGCHVFVHASCYGASDNDDEDEDAPWWCQRCAVFAAAGKLRQEMGFKEKHAVFSKYKCALCPLGHHEKCGPFVRFELSPDPWAEAAACSSASSSSSSSYSSSSSLASSLPAPPERWAHLICAASFSELALYPAADGAAGGGLVTLGKGRMASTPSSVMLKQFATYVGIVCEACGSSQGACRQCNADGQRGAAGSKADIVELDPGLSKARERQPSGGPRLFGKQVECQRAFHATCARLRGFHEVLDVGFLKRERDARLEPSKAASAMHEPDGSLAFCGLHTLKRNAILYSAAGHVVARKGAARPSDARYEMPLSIRDLFKVKQVSTFDYAANERNDWLRAFAARAGSFGEAALPELRKIENEVRREGAAASAAPCLSR